MVRVRQHLVEQIVLCVWVLMQLWYHQSSVYHAHHHAPGDHDEMESAADREGCIVEHIGRALPVHLEGLSLSQGD